MLRGHHEGRGTRMVRTDCGTRVEFPGIFPAFFSFGCPLILCLTVILHISYTSSGCFSWGAVVLSPVARAGKWNVARPNPLDSSCRLWNIRHFSVFFYRCPSRTYHSKYISSLLGIVAQKSRIRVPSTNNLAVSVCLGRVIWIVMTRMQSAASNT